jgi:hypothetical protein
MNTVITISSRLLYALLALILGSFSIFQYGVAALLPVIALWMLLGVCLVAKVATAFRTRSPHIHKRDTELLHSERPV